MNRHPLHPLLPAALLLLPALAFGGIGKVTVAEGKSSRTPRGGAPVSLTVGAQIELNDTIDVAKGGKLKVSLNDGSVIMLQDESRLQIDEAAFKDQQREGFKASLSFGRFWAKVQKTLSGTEAKFEVSTPRAVAGVRGTIFRVDAARLVSGATTRNVKAQAPATQVTVKEGKVGVEAQVRPQARTAVAKDGAAKEPRRQVKGPAQLKDAAEWEKRFVELQRGMSVTVGDDLTEALLTPSQLDGAFAAFGEEEDR